MNLKDFAESKGFVIQKSKINCIYHKDRNPSLHIYDDNFYCFSCGKYGDTAQFVQDYLGVNFVEACRIIGRELSEKIILKHKFFEKKKQELKSFSCSHYKLSAYLMENDISQETAKIFEITYDQSANAIVFPIKKHGNILAFGRRYLDTSFRKWDCGANNAVWIKKENIYINNHISDLINQKGYVYVVEGITDAIALFQIGEPAIALLGCFFNETKANEILKLNCDKIIIFGDPDDAGQKLNNLIVKNLIFNPKYNLQEISLFCHSSKLDPADHVKIFNALHGTEICAITEFLKKKMTDFVGKRSSESLVLKPAIDKGFEGIISRVPPFLKPEIKKIKNKLSEGKCWIKNTSSLHDICEDFKEIDAKKCFQFGFGMLDQYISIDQGNFGIIASQTGCGKTTFLLNIISNFLEKDHNFNDNDIDIGFFALEMSKSEVIRALLKVISGKGGATNPVAISLALEQKNSTIELFDNIRNIDLLVQQIRLLKASKLNLKVVFIDHFHRITSDIPDMVVSCTKISEKLANLAKELNVAIIAAAQLNRQSTDTTTTEYKPLTVGGLKWSSAIEQDADWILLLNRPDAFYKEKIPFSTGKAKEVLLEKLQHYNNNIFLSIAKNRKSGTKTVIKFIYQNDFLEQSLISHF